MKIPLKLNQKMLIVSVFTFCAVLSLSILLPEYTPDTTPEEWYEYMITRDGIKEHPRGEDFCWYARAGMDRSLRYYEATQNTDWLDAAVQYNDFLLGKMDTAPDGYKGWIGPYGYDGKYWCAVHVGDALLFSGILDFVILVRDDPVLAEKYRDKIMEYTESAKRNFVEKWDARGTFREDEPFGAYVQYEKYMRPGKFDTWVEGPDVNQTNMAQPFNKQNDAAQVSLRLYRITGDTFYRDKAVKIYSYMKSRFQYFNNHYVWNYWEPFGPNDIELERKRARHWIGIHPYRSGYTAREVEQIVDAYHTGIVFSETDMQRIINTNLEVMWNKSFEEPDFINANGLGRDGDTTGLGAFQAQYGHSNARKNAGELWTPLVDFSQTVRDIYERRFRNKNSFYWYYYQNFTAAEPPSFKRKHLVDGVVIKDFQFTESADLYCVAALPHNIKRGQQTILICKSMNPGNLEISVYSDRGKELVLYEGSMEGTKDIGGGMVIITWNGTDPAGEKSLSGSYRIRWSINDGYREFPVNIGM